MATQKRNVRKIQFYGDGIFQVATTHKSFTCKAHLNMDYMKRSIFSIYGNKRECERAYDVAKIYEIQKVKL